MPTENDTDRTPRQTSKLEPPGDLRLLLAFLNMSDVDSPRALADWLAHRRLVAPETGLGESDLELAIEVREATRTLLVRGPAAEVDAAAARLDQAMTAATIRTRFGAGGRIRLEPSPRGLDGALARLCGILAAAQLEGTWQRLKVCGARNCGAAFFDDSKNHSRKWCSKRCCSRSTSLAHRRRHPERVRKAERGNAYMRREFGPRPRKGRSRRDRDVNGS